jgi:hypothetical protein
MSSSLRAIRASANARATLAAILQQFGLEQDMANRFGLPWSEAQNSAAKRHEVFDFLDPMCLKSHCLGHLAFFRIAGFAQQFGLAFGDIHTDGVAQSLPLIRLDACLDPGRRVEIHGDCAVALVGAGDVVAVGSASTQGGGSNQSAQGDVQGFHVGSPDPVWHGSLLRMQPRKRLF